MIIGLIAASYGIPHITHFRHLEEISLCWHFLLYQALGILIALTSYSCICSTLIQTKLDGEIRKQTIMQIKATQPLQALISILWGFTQVDFYLPASRPSPVASITTSHTDEVYFGLRFQSPGACRIYQCKSTTTATIRRALCKVVI